jgi:predicted Zn finger-like uncharacterized protein
MSLATRCTSCGTVFRVVQDQLKVSEGWVRCGRCAEVFNALEGLFDLEGSSGPMTLPREAATSPPTAVGVDIDIDQIPIAQHAEPDVPLDFEAMLAPSADEAPDDTQALAHDTLADTRAGESDFARSGPRSSQFPLDIVDSHVPSEALSAHGFETAEPSASFLRHAARDAQWQRPRVRRALAALASLLGLILVLQFSLQQRDALAARWPGTAPLLSGLCNLFGCSVQAPRALEAMAVESSGLTRLDAAALYRLQVTLRNRAATPVLSPALDLTLTDLRGEVIVRRVLAPADLGAAAPREIAPGADWPINALLDVGEVRVAGYTVELFYP